ncbi:MAG: hypothetical protein JKY66_00465, partial [Spongiibacteraceae bacterium]|nr:hypothetical protein [Spongiibacteraceae bacterium]
GAMLTLPRRVGVAKARQLMTAGQVTSGEQAFELGLADEYLGDGDVMAAAIGRAQQFAQLPQTAFAHFKDRLNHPSQTLEEELQREQVHQVSLLQGPEFNAGYDAVINKKSVDFSQIPRNQPETVDE